MNFSAVLLVGGESRRMRRDKATLEWCGRPLWQWQIEKLRAARPREILLSARSDVAWRPADIKLVLDVSLSRGPLSGLTAALAAAETDHLLALAIDMPFITTAHLRRLCDRATNGIGVVPMINGRAEPLCAIYPREAQAIFEQALQNDDYSLQPIVQKLIALNLVKEISVPDTAGKIYKSVNEPQDLE